MESKVYIDPYPKTMKMLGLERINIDCGNNTSIVTPANIAKDMVALLPDEVFIPESKFLDICCKSGIFLTSIREKLMNSKAMIEAISDDKERYRYITDNQLYGIAPNGQCQMYSVRAVYGTLKVDNPHILCFGAFDQYKTACLNNNHKMLIDEMKKEFNTMKFDVVIGNPPYNNDIYLDFVTLGHTLANKYDCWITPAKWQAKGGQKNEDFRKNIVPYMSKIVYYPDAKDIFEIKIQGGVAYYLCNKMSTTTVVINRCKKNSKLNSCSTRILTKNPLLLNIGNEIMEKINTQCLNKVRCELSDKYGVYIINAYMNGAIMLNTGNTLLLGDMHIEDNNIPIIGKSDVMIFSADNIDICKSFISYVSTKFIRFLAFMLIDGQQPKFNNIWKFIPNQEAFDHIFTDQELYKEYKLTPEEINIIESVIKERK